MTRIIGIGVAALALATSLTAQQVPAALVIRVQGDVAVTHGEEPPVPASIGERMFVGDGVLPDDGSSAVLITRGGAQQVVTEETTIGEPRGGGNPHIFDRALATLAQAASTDASTGGRQGMIRPIPGQTSLVAPRNQLTVVSARPLFTWTATPGQSYDLMLRPIAGGPPQLFQVGPDTTWTLPDDMEDLEMGAEYQWTVFVGGRQGGRAMQPQNFRVLGLEESVELQDYLDEIAVFGLDPRSDGLFLTTVAYRDMGLFYEAREALAAVERDGPLSWELYRLKGEIMTELGREEEARAAFDRADERMR
jgi:hypothetical protein